MTPLYAPAPDWISVLVLALTALAVLCDHFSEDDPDSYSPEAPRQPAPDEYADGVVDEQELERILETTEDPETTHIQALVRPIRSVGPKTSWTIAEHFDSVEDLRDADRSDLEAIHGVGPSLSATIVKRFEE